MEKFILERNKIAIEFNCSRCNKDKKSKNIAHNAEGAKLCNGCFGFLLSKNLIVKG